MSAAAESPDDAGLSMAAYCDEVARWALPEEAAPLLAAGLQAGTARRLLRSPRLSERASALLVGGLGRGEPGTLPEADRRLVLASTRTLERAAILAGAVWHSAQVRALVLAQDVAAFVDELGEDARDAALRHATLAPAPSGGTIPAHGLAAAIRRDGAACLSAWIDALPGWASGRMRLRWRATDGSAGGEADTTRVAGPHGAAERLARDPALRAQAAGIVRAVQP